MTLIVPEALTVEVTIVKEISHPLVVIGAQQLIAVLVSNMVNIVL